VALYVLVFYEGNVFTEFEKKKHHAIEKFVYILLGITNY